MAEITELYCKVKAAVSELQLWKMNLFNGLTLSVHVLLGGSCNVRFISTFYLYMYINVYIYMYIYVFFFFYYCLRVSQTSVNSVLSLKKWFNEIMIFSALITVSV